MEEESHDKHLQAGHGNHHAAFDDGEIKDTSFRAAHRAEVPVFARAEVLLEARDGVELARQLVDGLLERGRLLRGGALLLREGGAGFVLDLWTEDALELVLVRKPEASLG